MQAGDPIFLSPDYRVDPLLGLYVQSATFRKYAAETKRNYATDITLLLTFLWGRGGKVAAGVTRSKKDRTFYAAAGAIGEIEAYADSSRAWAVAQAQRKGLYERLPGARVVTEVTRRTRPVVRWRGLDGPSGERPLSELTVRERMTLLTEGPRGWSRCGCG